MRRIASALVGAVAVTGLVVVPAAAEKPVIDEGTSVFEDINPCTGELHEITINYADRVQAPKKNGNVVVQLSAVDGSTSDGYVLLNSSGRVVENGKWFKQQFTDTWKNFETGSQLQASLQLMVNTQTGVVTREDFRLRCLGKAPTE